MLISIFISCKRNQTENIVHKKFYNFIIFFYDFKFIYGYIWMFELCFKNICLKKRSDSEQAVTLNSNVQKRMMNNRLRLHI